MSESQDWLDGYDAGLAAGRATNEIYIAARGDGVEEGRRQVAGELAMHMDAMLATILGAKVVRVHTGTCWTRHTECALRSVRKAAVRRGGLEEGTT